MDKRPRTRMSKQEKEDWDCLYDYVRYNVMGYDENMSLPRNWVLRLKGMAVGKHMANNYQKDMAKYPFSVILNAFKYSMPEIQRALSNVSFADSNHRFNYIMRIVDSNLNTVYMRMKNVEKAKREAEREVTVADTHQAVEYKPSKKTERKDRFADLW